MALISYITPPVEDKAILRWLMWNYDRQTATHKELVTVSSHNDMSDVNGDVVVPFSPLYWHHPEKGKWIQRAISDGAGFAGSRLVWFVDLKTLSARRFYYREVPKSMMGYSKKDDNNLIEEINIPTTMIINFEGGSYNRTIDDPKSFFTRKAWGKTISELRKLSKAVSS